MLPRWLSGKESACSAGETGDAGLTPALGSSPEGGHGNPLQYSCLENPLDRGGWWATVHGVAESDTTETRGTRACTLTHLCDEVAGGQGGGKAGEGDGDQG